MNEVHAHMGHGYRLRVPHDAELLPSLEKDPRFPLNYVQTIGDVPLRIFELLRLRPYAISRLTEYRDNDRLGWRDMGLEGSDCDWYACAM